MGFYDAFFGSDQSQYTAYAIVAAIIAICITILLTATDVPVSNRLLIVFFVIISLVPSVFLTLFELTCIVTGGTEPNHWWCNVFAWILAAFIIIYCIFIVIISLISLFTYNNAIDNVKVEEQKDRLTPEVSNNYAKQIINNDEENTKQIEKFYAELVEKNRHSNPEVSIDNSKQIIPNNDKKPEDIEKNNNEMASSDEKIEEFVYTYSQTAADVAARNANQAAIQETVNANSYSSDLTKLYAKYAKSSLPKRRWFTDYGSINSNEDFEDSKYFIYDDFKKN
jgi:hypothetical protein